MEREQLGYLPARDGAPLYAAYHAPAQAQAGAAVLICPPLFEERKSAYAALRKLALRLAAVGHAVLRFDYRGSGESGGSSAGRRWLHLAEDATAAREKLARLSGREDVVLLGLRLGATLALWSAAAGRRSSFSSGAAGLKAVIALAPILNGAAQVRQWKLRSKIRAELTDGGGTAFQAVKDHGQDARATDGGGTAFQAVKDHGQDARATIDFDGYEVHPGFFDDVAALDLLQAPPAAPGPALVVQLSHRSEPSLESKQFVAAWGGKAELKCLRVEPFWDKLDDVDTRPLEDMVCGWVSSF